MSEDRFVKIYCALCEGKIYLDDIPEDGTDSDKFQEYLNKLVRDGHLGAWHGDGGVQFYDEYEYTCIACTPDMARVTVGIGYDDPETIESLKAHFGDQLEWAVFKQWDLTATLEFAFNMHKNEIPAFYTMLQIMAGLDMPMDTQTDMGMFVNGERYPSPS